MNTEIEKISEQIFKMTDQAKDTKELFKIIHNIAYTIGGMICFFPPDDRSQVTMDLTQSIVYGHMLTAKNIGEPCDIEMIVGHGGESGGSET
ncbi:hypothetical protein ACFCP7_10545 [Paenibacillus elgii]